MGEARPPRAFSEGNSARKGTCSGFLLVSVERGGLAAAAMKRKRSGSGRGSRGQSPLDPRAGVSGAVCGPASSNGGHSGGNPAPLPARRRGAVLLWASERHRRFDGQTARGAYGGTFGTLPYGIRHPSTILGPRRWQIVWMLSGAVDSSPRHSEGVLPRIGPGGHRFTVASMASRRPGRMFPELACSPLVGRGYTHPAAAAPGRKGFGPPSPLDGAGGTRASRVPPARLRAAVSGGGSRRAPPGARRASGERIRAARMAGFRAGHSPQRGGEQRLPLAQRQSWYTASITRRRADLA